MTPDVTAGSSPLSAPLPSFSAIADSAAGSRKVFSFTWNGVSGQMVRTLFKLITTQFSSTITVAEDETPETPSTPTKPSKKKAEDFHAPEDTSAAALLLHFSLSHDRCNGFTWRTKRQ